MAEFLMMSGKSANLVRPQIKLIWNKGYDVKTSVFGVTNKILLLDWNSIVEVVKWPKFGNFAISMTEVIITSIL